MSRSTRIAPLLVLGLLLASCAPGTQPAPAARSTGQSPESQAPLNKPLRIGLMSEPNALGGNLAAVGPGSRSTSSCSPRN
jgi:hypothetical protein